jgi:hypothetical protein
MKLAAFTVLVLIGSCLPQQAPDPRAAAESRPGASDPKAVEIFRKALAAQTEGGSAPSIRDLHADLEVTMHDTDPKTKERTRKSATVVEYYRDRGAERPLFRRHLIDKLQGTETIQGYDGAMYWQKLGTTAARELRGRESKDEVDRIKSEIARTRDYLKLLFLSNLDGPDVTWQYVGAGKLKSNMRERAVEIIAREKPKEARIELSIGDSEGKPVLYGFSRKLESGKTELITFAVHRVLKSGGVTALVPLVAEYREDGMLTFEARAAKEADLRFNVGIQDATFAMPR